MPREPWHDFFDDDVLGKLPQTPRHPPKDSFKYSYSSARDVARLASRNQREARIDSIIKKSDSTKVRKTMTKKAIFAIGGVDFLVGVSSDNVSFTFEAATYFKLNPKPEVVRQFFEQICLHDHCTDLSNGGGWDKMLAQYFRPQIENAVRLETGKYTREQLYRDPDTLLAMQNDISAILNKKITDAIGGEFFCGPDATISVCPNLTFIIKNPTPPDNVAAAYNDTAAAAQKVITAQNDAAAKVAAANGERDAQNARAEAKALSVEQIAYINAQAALACANSPSCTLIINSGGGTGVNVNIPANTTP